jgi:hypothetical protein
VRDTICAWIDRRGVISCLAVAIALRVLLMGLMSGQLTQDRDAYLGIAHAVADGRGFCHADDGTPTAFRPPVYPLQLAGLMVALPDSLAVGIVNLVWSVVAVWLTCRLGRTLGLGRWALMSGLLVAVDPLLLQYSTQPMTESACTGLVACLLVLVVAVETRTPLRLIGAGVAFGLLVLCRPTFWPLAGLLVITHFWSRPTLQSWALSALYAVLGTLLIVGPWVVRNQVVMGSPILTTTHGGYTLLLGNNPTFYSDVVSRGWGTPWKKESFDKWQTELQLDIARELGPHSTEQQRDRWQNAKARTWIADHPSEFAHAMWYRVLSLWSPIPQPENSSSMNPWIVGAIGLYYIAILLGFITGMVIVALQKRWLVWWPLFALVLTVQLVHLAYWTNARMRAPIVPVISLFAVVPFIVSFRSAKDLPAPELASGVQRLFR